MPVPKSVTKINKNGITFKSDVDKANYFLYELSRAALRDVAKLIKKRFREKYYGTFRRVTGQAPKANAYNVYSKEHTKKPRVDIGFEHSSRKKTVQGFYARFQELGTQNGKRSKKNSSGVHMKARGMLQDVIDSSVSDIVMIESQYLSGLEEEARALSMGGTEDEMTDEKE